MNKEALLFFGGVVTGIAVSAVGLYFYAPKIAEKASGILVRALANEAGVSPALVAPFTPFIGRAANQAVRDALPV